MAIKRAGDVNFIRWKDSIHAHDLHNKQLACYSYKPSEKSNSRIDTNDIVDFAVKGSTLAVAYNDKTIEILEFKNESFIVKKTTHVQKRPTSIVFHPRNENVLLADKTGDIYDLDFETKCDDQKPILGHVSMLLSIAAGERFILSADRDEKIKVSLIDKPFVIHGYLLGHSQFVRNVYCLQGFAVSFSGDFTVKLWNLDSCKEISSLNVPKTAVFMRENLSQTGYQVICSDRNIIEVTINGNVLESEAYTMPTSAQICISKEESIDSLDYIPPSESPDKCDFDVYYKSTTGD